MTVNGIGDEGAKALSEMLQVNTTLTSVNLWSEEEEKKKERYRARKERKTE